MRCWTAAACQVDGPALAIPSGSSVGATGCPFIGQFCACWSNYSDSHLEHEAIHFLRYIIILTVSSLYFSPPALSLNPNFRNALLYFPFAISLTATKPVTGMSNLWRHFVHSAPHTASNRTVSLLQRNTPVVLTVFRQYYSYLRTHSFRLSALLLNSKDRTSPLNGLLSIQSIQVAPEIDSAGWDLPVRCPRKASNYIRIASFHIPSYSSYHSLL